MTTASTRIWTFAAVLLMITVVALGWFLVASPKLADAARFDAERRSVEAQNNLARATIAQLEADLEQIDELRDQLRDLRSEFPNAAEYDVVVEEFLTGMIVSGLELRNVSITEPSPTSAVAVADEEASEGETDGSGELASGSLLRISASVTVGGPVEAILEFINRLQLSPRFSIIPTGTYSQGTNEVVRSMTFDVIMYAVTGDDLPDDESAEREPEPTPTPMPTESGSPTPTPTPTP